MRLPGVRVVVRLILPVVVLCRACCLSAEEPVSNEINSLVEEPLINLPEAGASIPLRSASRSRSSYEDDLKQLVQDAVDSTRRRLLSTDANSPWQVMHGQLALRQNFHLKHQGRVVSGLEWIATGPGYEGEPWFEKTLHGGRAHPYSRPWAFEGHANQFLAILSMSALPLDQEFGTPRGPITMADMLRHAQKEISTKDEPTWTLWALSRYLPSDAAWTSAAGEPWSIERLVSIQTARPVKGSACGGTHGLFALAHARNVYLRTGQPLRGVWLESEYKIRRYISYAREQQNSNGMLSTNYFRGREYDPDFNKRMASAGHILEFLMIALSQDELHERWVRRAIDTTARDLLRNRRAFVKCSPLYHAVNALNIYLDRVRVENAQVTRNEQDESQLQRVEEGKDGLLKSVPVIRISGVKDLSGGTDPDAAFPPRPDGGLDPPPLACPVPEVGARTWKRRAGKTDPDRVQVRRSTLAGKAADSSNSSDHSTADAGTVRPSGEDEEERHGSGASNTSAGDPRSDDSKESPGDAEADNAEGDASESQNAETGGSAGDD